MKRDKPDTNGDDDNADGEGGDSSHSSDKIDPWGENPDWDPSWVKAHKINYLGRVKSPSSVQVNISLFLDCQLGGVWAVQHCLLGNRPQPLLLRVSLVLFILSLIRSIN